MHPDHAAALAFQEDLTALTTELAKAISVAPSRRDNDQIRGLWDQIEGRKSLLAKHVRSVRKLPQKRSAELSAQDYRTQKEGAKLARVMAKQLQCWTLIADLVDRHVDPEPHGLLQDRPIEQIDSLLTKTYTALHKLANTNAQAEQAEDLGCFADIPMRIQAFELLMQAAYRLRHILGGTDDLRFLDVGCGGGTKVFAATRYFRWCDGLEYDPGYAEAGQRTLAILDPDHCRVFQGDGLTWDRYGDYDVIYFYRPLQDDDLLRQMENHIIATARPGTIILAPYDAFVKPRQGGIACSQIEDCIFVTGLTQAQADQLRHDAERTGPHRVRRAKDFNFDPGVWTPILEAATHDIGFPPTLY